MPVFKDFSENGDLLQTRNEPLKAENLARYIKENGVEKAQGYLEALEDMTQELEECFVKCRFQGEDGEIIIYNSKVIIKRKTAQLQEQKLAFLEFAKSVIEKAKQTNEPDLNTNLQPE